MQSLLFTQRDFSTENGKVLLLAAWNVSGAVCNGPMFDPWNGFLDMNSPDGNKAYEVAVIGRKDARNTSERFFGVNCEC